MTKTEQDIRHLWLQLIALPCIYYAGAKLSLAFAVMPESLVMMWIPNGILLAALFHFHVRRFGYFVALIIAAEIAADHSAFTVVESALFGVTNLLEISISYFLLRRWHFDPRFSTPRDLATFVIAAPVVSAFISACAGTAINSYFHGSENNALEFHRIWWFSDGLGLLILTPLVLSLWPPGIGAPQEHIQLRWYDFIMFTISLCIMALFIFTHQHTYYGMTLRPFLLIPNVLYVAVRFSVQTTAAMITVTAFLILYLVKSGEQLFGHMPVLETTTAAQELIFVMSAMSLGIAALLSQHRAIARELESRVQERTAALLRANRELQQLALTDSLTGLLNRRALFDLLSREMTREKRYDRPLALIMLDIDHFKQVNDRHGHAAGDTVLKQVASICTLALRNSDSMARFGGEEFVIMAPEAGQDSALQLAERLRIALRSTDIEVDHTTLRVTASFGVAMLSADDQYPEQLFRRADDALYKAKTAGRDRVMLGISGK